jgi:hypothetical protein
LDRDVGKVRTVLSEATQLLKQVLEGPVQNLPFAWLVRPTHAPHVAVAAVVAVLPCNAG